MEKNADLLIAQCILVKGWVSPLQLTECMRISQRNAELSLGDILVQKKYISKEQLALVENALANKPPENSLPKNGEIKSEKAEVPTAQGKGSSSKKEPLSELNLHDDFPIIPRQIGPYKILSEIGRGGMGVVYKIKHPDLDFPLALKVLLQNDESSNENAMRFYREIELASKLRHPNIVGIHDVGSYNACPYYTMDYIEGQTLDKILKAKIHLPERFALEIIEKVASGLASAHKAKIIHRDLKPANIIVDEKNRVYLMDFGIAKCREKMFKDLTRTGTIMGTPDYMSPEQASGKIRKVSFQSDVYSLGATLYHMLTGKPPFDGESPVDIITNVLTQDVVPVRQLRPEISRQTEAIVMKALSKNIEDRYPNAGAFAIDVRTALSGGKTIAKPESHFKIFLRFLKRHALFIACFVVTCVAILTTVILLMKAFK